MNSRTLLSAAGIAVFAVLLLGNAPTPGFRDAFVPGTGGPLSSSVPGVTKDGGFIDVNLSTLFPIYANYNQGYRGGTFSSATLDSIATLDVAEMQGDLFESTAPTDLTDQLRSRNSDIILLNYLQHWAIPYAWSGWPAGTYGKRYWDFVNDTGGSRGYDLWPRTAAGDTVVYPGVPSWRLVNFVGPGGAYADSLADFHARVIKQSPNLAAYTGVFIDIYGVLDYPDWPCQGTGGYTCTSMIDLDLDGNAYSSDGTESALYKAALIEFTTRLRDQVATDGFLVVSNGEGFAQSPSYAATLDGAMAENVGTYYPTDKAEWTAIFAHENYGMSTAILSRPLMLMDWHGLGDLNDHEAEGAMVAIGLAGAAPSCISTGGPAGVLGRRFWAPIAPHSSVGRIDLGSVVSDAFWIADGDTVYRQYSKGYVKATPLDGYPFEYVVVDSVTTPASPDTLFISASWPRQTDTTAPDQIIDLAVLSSYGSAVDLVWTANDASDLAGYNLYRGYETGVLTLFDVLDPGSQGEYTDTTVSTSGDTTYYYAIAAFDSSANEATLSNEVNATPTVAPLEFTAFAAATPTIADTTATRDAAMVISAATVNRAAAFQLKFWDAESTEPDTALAGNWITPVSTTWDSTYASGIAVPVATTDTSVTLSWDDVSGNLSYLLERNVSGAGWSTVAEPDSNDTSYVDASAPRGELNYRIRSIFAGPDTSAVTLVDSLFYNEAVRVYARAYAIDDWGQSPLASSAVTGLWASEAYSVGSEGTPENYFTITVDADSVRGTSDLYNYPMLITAVNFPDDALDSDLETVFSGGGIRIIDAAGDTLAREIVDFTPNATPSSATAEIWVKVDTLSYSSDTVLTVLYSSSWSEPAASSAYGSESVWSDYLAVYHMSDVSESSGNTGDGIASGDLPTLISGKVGGAQYFDGTGDLISLPSMDFGTGSATLECWAQVITGTSYGTIIGIGTSGDNELLRLGYDAAKYLRCDIETSTSAQVSSQQISGQEFETSTWHYAAAIFDRSAWTLLHVFDLDSSGGATDISAATGTINSATSGHTALGEYSDALPRMDGNLDEVRVSASTRTADWLKTGFSNQSSPGAFAINGELQ